MLDATETRTFTVIKIRPFKCESLSDAKTALNLIEQILVEIYELLNPRLNTRGGFIPVSMKDAEAEKGTLYYSTTTNKLTFKDSSGVANVLY